MKKLGSNVASFQLEREAESKHQIQMSSEELSTGVWKAVLSMGFQDHFFMLKDTKFVKLGL